MWAEKVMDKVITGEGEWPNLGEQLPEVPSPHLAAPQEIKTFFLNIKSHSGDGFVPDYEDVVSADNINEAAKLFWEKMPNQGKAEWTPEMLIPNIAVLP